MANFILGVQTEDTLKQKIVLNDLKSSSDFKSDSSSNGQISTNTDGISFEEDVMTLAPDIRSNEFKNNYSPFSLPNTPKLFRRHTQPDSIQLHNNRKSNQRHYKKDSRYVMDLYTLTFDENETLDDIDVCKKVNLNLGHEYEAGGGESTERYLSLNPVTIIAAKDADSGPKSLGSGLSAQTVIQQAKTLPSLETNLHKILARKIQDSEEISFKKAKLLTKAYYKLLRESTRPIIDPKVRVLQLRDIGQRAKPIGQGKMSWQSLLTTDKNELKRIVNGLNNTIKALSDFLMDLLMERDELIGRQDDMLEEISELTDELL